MPRGCLLHEACTQFVGDSNLPWRSGRNLFASNEAVIQPAMNGGRIDAQDLRRLANRHHVPRGWFGRRFIARNVAIATQATNLIRREALSRRGFASLTIENARDHIVGVMNSQTTKQSDRIFVGMEALRFHARQGEIALRERAALPAHRRMPTTVGPIHPHNHYFQQGTQEFLAIAIGGGRRPPDLWQFRTEREEFLFLLLTHRARALCFSPLELRFGGG